MEPQGASFQSVLPCSGVEGDAFIDAAPNARPYERIRNAMGANEMCGLMVRMRRQRLVQRRVRQRALLGGIQHVMEATDGNSRRVSIAIGCLCTTRSMGSMPEAA